MKVIQISLKKKESLELYKLLIHKSDYLELGLQLLAQSPVYRKLCFKDESKVKEILKKIETPEFQLENQVSGSSERDVEKTSKMVETEKTNTNEMSVKSEEMSVNKETNKTQAHEKVISTKKVETIPTKDGYPIINIKRR